MKKSFLTLQWIKIKEMNELENIWLNSLLRKNTWVTVQPTKTDLWKASIYKKSELGFWRVDLSTKKDSPKECYDWIDKMLLTKNN